ncbi:MAG: hypothetical protein LH679_04680 [Cyanobacteria bacterium CAN_BIN43]|nr:hypothetical protein [Cyanobacteria bacterium CAN_BIN43]
MPLPNVALSTFQDGQIIYLQHEALRLYAETIQIIKTRKLCWARPLALIQLPAERYSDRYEALMLHDLRQGSDLLLPISLFQIALDTETIPVITQLNAPKNDLPIELFPDGRQPSFPILQNFVHQVWQAHSEEFSR